MEIRKVLLRRDGIKYCIIPKKSEINAGELVAITNNLNMIEKFQKEEKNAKRGSS